MIVVVWFILHTESRYCIVVLVLSFVCYTCEIARNGKPCVVALNILSLSFFLSSFYMFVYTLAHMNNELMFTYYTASTTNL